MIPANPPKPPVAASKAFADKGAWLAAAGRFKEEEHEVEGIGVVLFSEISAAARAEILGQMASAMQPDPETKEKGKLDTVAYQKALLLAGVVDPNSPAGSRNPLFKAGDMDAVMRIGGAAVTEAVAVVERLSKMGRWQVEAEGNSEPTPSGASTSG